MNAHAAIEEQCKGTTVKALVEEAGHRVAPIGTGKRRVEAIPDRGGKHRLHDVVFHHPGLECRVFTGRDRR